jgi:hypothetical protein
MILKLSLMGNNSRSCVSDVPNFPPLFFCCSSSRRAEFFSETTIPTNDNTRTLNEDIFLTLFVVCSMWLNKRLWESYSDPYYDTKRHSVWCGASACTLSSCNHLMGDSKYEPKLFSLWTSVFFRFGSFASFCVMYAVRLLLSCLVKLAYKIIAYTFFCNIFGWVHRKRC